MPALAAQPDVAASAQLPAAVKTCALSKSIDERPILQDINFEVPPGRYVGLLGANGAGKSTLLKILATLMPACSGELLIFGTPVTRDAPKLRSRIGLIGHQSMLYRDLTALENLEFFGQLYGIEHPLRRAETLLEAVGMLDRADDPVKALSRGMAQRVAIARALIHNPDLLLADEPFDGLDAPSVRSLEELLSHLHQSGKTIVLVNHDIAQSLRLVERAVVLRMGRVVIDQPAQNLTADAVLKEMQRT